MRYRGRKGITLLEVLVSIFIMGIGMLALLTLFPLGAVNMARALQDDRASSAANIASETAVAKDLRHDPGVVNAFLTPPGLPPLAPTAAGPSYPVHPYMATLAPLLGQPPNAIPRTSVSYAPSGPAINRWFSLQDDMTFGEDALPPGAPTQVIQKGGRYTWSYLLRRPRASSDAVVDLWVIVYAGRDTQTFPPTGEDSFPAQGARGANTLLVSYAGPDKPATRKGTWVLDVTADPTTGVPQGNFYRVVNVSDSGPNQLALEVDPPLKANVGNPAANTNGVIVVMENVIDVFEKGSSWYPGNP
jgi:prepilin-type N-terminal cleavage/methylation domain-containing protein